MMPGPRASRPTLRALTPTIDYEEEERAPMMEEEAPTVKKEPPDSSQYPPARDEE
jgi:hypothetical protein